MNDPRQAVVDIIFGRWRSQILYAGVTLGVFDALSGGTRSATDLAAELRLDPLLTYRLMRALGCLGLLSEDSNRSFSLTASGEFLRTDHPQTLRGMTLLEEEPEHYAVWKHLCAMIRDGKHAYILKHILHDWSDVECVQILANMYKGGAASGQGLRRRIRGTRPGNPALL